MADLSFRSMPLLRLFLALLLSGVLPVRAQPSGNLGWSELGNRRGATVDFPGGLFRRADADNEGGKLSFLTEDGASRFELFSIENKRRETPAEFARRAENGRERLDYKRITGNFLSQHLPYRGGAFFIAVVTSAEE
jgi:hypothetical protein